ncbi:hypothetical protein HED60_21560 [Planctomycetales bacterium ZRK34]|nr:hypothetical protein HED60_21560 [Planctomycetales bacterium ZRK34]
MLRAATAFCVVLLLSLSTQAAEGPTLPDGAKGFAGQLRGTVVEKVAKGKGFRLKVAAIGKTFPKNNATNPQVLVGESVLINAQWRKGENGKWHPVENHIRFIRSLKPGQEITIEVINDEGGRLHILELTHEQRNAGEGERR